MKEGKEASEKELIDYCKKNLAHYKVPRRVGFLEEFPISAAGKILRRELRKMDTER